MDRDGARLWLPLLGEGSALKRSRPLRRYFVRVFISMMLTIGLVLGIEGAIVTFSNWRMQTGWPALVTDDYIKASVSLLEDADTQDPDAVKQAFLTAKDDRISGILIRDFRTGLMYLYGSTPDWLEGRPAKTNIVQEVSDDDSWSFEKDVPVYGIDISTSTDDQVSISSYSEMRGLVHYVAPSFVRIEDVASTIFVSVAGEVVCSLDLLVLGMHDFGPTRFIMDSIIVTMVWLVPVCIIVSILASFFLSRRGSRSIEAIRQALERMAHGDYAISLPAAETSEIDLISHSIESLAGDLERNKESRKMWLRSIAHDLNTPLSALRLLVEGLEDGIYVPDEAFISSLKKELMSLEARISSVRYYTGLLSSSVHLERRPVKVSQLLAPWFADPRIVISVTPPDALLMLDGDLAGRMVKELVDNALNATKEGPVRISYADKILTVSNRARLPQPLPDFFEPWQRGDESRHGGGSGLGLPIVAQIMALHGGRAEIAQRGEDVVVTLHFVN